jgi:O6-methylguanine-DNA--protein-cysteine methyltransferase
MAKYSLEIKARARDYYEIHSKNLEDIGSLLNIPVTTLSDWKRKEKWYKGQYEDKVQEAKEKLNETIKEKAIFEEVKDDLVAELKAHRPHMLATTVEEDQIIDNRAVSILLEAAAIENLDALAMEGVKLANKKLQYMNNLPLAKVSMGEIKTYNDIVANVKTQIYGKAPDVVINNMNSANMSVDDYSKMSTDELYKMLDKQNKQESIEQAKDRDIM